MGGAERRQHARIALRKTIALSGRSLGHSKGEMVNISRRGFLLVSPVEMHKGTRVRFKAIWLPSRLCTADGEVIRAQGGQYGISLSATNEAFEQLVTALEMCDTSEIDEIWRGLISCGIEVREASSRHATG